MSCKKCGSENVRRLGPISAIEDRICDDCGETYAVLCHYIHYPIERAELFRGYCEVKGGADSIKTHIKLKKILANYTHTKAKHLEDQFLQKLTTWDIGVFYDTEIDRIKEDCRLHGINATFVKEDG